MWGGQAQDEARSAQLALSLQMQEICPEIVREIERENEMMSSSLQAQAEAVKCILRELQDTQVRKSNDTIDTLS